MLQRHTQIYFQKKTMGIIIFYILPLVQILFPFVLFKEMLTYYEIDLLHYATRNDIFQENQKSFTNQLLSALVRITFYVAHTFTNPISAMGTGLFWL